MPELFLELFSEEIPARMQAGAAADLARLLAAALEPLAPTAIRTFYGPRRIALVTDVRSEVAASQTVERGPRTSAPEQALTGFLRKHGATKDDLRQEGDYWILHKSAPAQSAANLVAETLPPLLWRFPWPKSMRWGAGSQFTWVRPLRRITCLLDGEVVRFDLRQGGQAGDDDGHGLVSSNETEGHRFHAPGPIRVTSCAQWQEALARHRVIVDAAERRTRIADGIAALAEARDLSVVPDDALLDEVAGLVEWPVPLLGRIDNAFMDLPPEVLQVSMRVNQRYFTLRTKDGAAAPGSPSSPTSKPRMAALPSSPETNGSCVPASPMRATSGTSTARPPCHPASQPSTPSRSTPNSAPRPSAFGASGPLPARSRPISAPIQTRPIVPRNSQRPT